jgi:hypothetical protein
MKTSEIPKIHIDGISLDIKHGIGYTIYIGGISMFKLALGGMMDSKINLTKHCEIE